MANETSANASAAAGTAGAASGGTPVLGLLVVSAVLGTLIGLLVLATMQHDKNVPTVGGETETPVSGRTTLDAAPPASGTASGAADSDQAIQSATFTSTNGASVSSALQPRALQSSTSTLQQNRGSRSQPNTSRNRGQLTKSKPTTRPSAVSRPAPVKPGLDTPTGQISAELLGGARTLKPGEEFVLELSLGELGGKLLDYTAELRFNPKQISIESIEGVKGGFTVPTNVVKDPPGKASWRAADAQSTFHHDVSIALVKGRIADDATGKVRIYINPSALNVELPGLGARRIGALARAVPLQVE